MSAYDDAVDECVELFDRFHRACKFTNRCAEKLQAAEAEFLNAVDEQSAIYDDAMAAFARKEALTPGPDVIEHVGWLKQ